MQDHAARVETVYDEQDQAVRKILTPTQYHVATEASRSPWAIMSFSQP